MQRDFAAGPRKGQKAGEQRQVNTMNRDSLRTRWMRNGAITLLLIMVFIVCVFGIAISSYYRSSLRNSLEAKAQTSSALFSGNTVLSYEEYRQRAYRYAENFSNKDKIELQLIGTDGMIKASSSGLRIGSRPDTEDIRDALTNGEASFWTGKRAMTGERIMTVSSPLLYQDEVIGVMRYVTGTRQMEQQILSSLLTVAIFGLCIVLLVLLSNLYFIRTITDPIQKLTDAAKRIADGSYGIQVSKKYDDEIGVLTDTINEMSTTLASAEKLQTEFISSVSHELRTPLTAITGWSETLLYDETIEGDSRRGLQIISKEANRLTKMVVELLEFTRMQDGRFTLNVETLDIAAVLEDVIFAYSSLLRQDGLKLQYTPCETDVPPIPGDAERLKQVFLNILDNAIKYGRDGEKIEVGMTAEADTVCITVRDYGNGIPENELPFVTQKFYKGSSKERGSGIGLSVCEEIITRHKGTLIVENAPEKGVLVTIKLPLLSS